MVSEQRPSNGRRELYLRILVRFVIFVIVILACVLIVPRIIGMILPFLFSLLLSWSLNPLIKRISAKLKLPRKPIAVILLILVFAAIVGVFVWAIYTLIYELLTLASNWETHWQNFGETISAIEMKMSGLGEQKASGAEMILWEAVDTVLSWLEDSLGYAVDMVVSITGSMASGVAGAAVALVAFIMSAYFITVDYPRLSWKINESVGMSVRKYAKGIKDNFMVVAGGYVKEKFILMVLAFAMMTIGFLIIGQSYALLVALLISIVGFVPFFGSGTILIPWAGICLLSGSIRKGIALLCIYLLVRVVCALVKSSFPKTKPGLTPVQLLVSIYAGYVLNGIFGMIWCPILLLIFLNFCKTGVFKNTVRDIKAAIEDLRRQTSRESGRRDT
jgi:sporulation integral membrane protein YtvI